MDSSDSLHSNSLVQQEVPGPFTLPGILSCLLGKRQSKTTLALLPVCQHCQIYTYMLVTKERRNVGQWKCSNFIWRLWINSVHWQFTDEGEAVMTFLVLWRHHSAAEAVKGAGQIHQARERNWDLCTYSSQAISLGDYFLIYKTKVNYSKTLGNKMEAFPHLRQLCREKVHCAQ